MDTANALAPETPAPVLDAKTLLARVNHRLTLLRSWLSHDHRDEPYWWARKITVRAAQAERQLLRGVANLLHVERATSRGRVHGTRFADLDEQRAWLERLATHGCPAAAAAAGLPANATLIQLREGRLPL